MEQLHDWLDLSVILTLPPLDALPETLASITLRCEALNLVHSGGLLRNPLTEKERESLHWYLEEYWKWPYEQFFERGKQVEKLLPDIGKRLYEAVFGSPEARDLVTEWWRYSTTQHQISIMSDLPSVLSLPWELFHDGHHFLALHSSHPVSIVRRLPQNVLATDRIFFKPPLRIMLVTARPTDLEFVDPHSIAHELVDEIQKQAEFGTIELEFLRPPTIASLKARLQDRNRPPVHILHFDGHGMFEEGMKEGVLAFERDGNWCDLIKGTTLAEVLQASEVRLVMLTACQSSTGSADDAFSSVAGQLIQGGMDAVVAMSARVLIASATRYVEAFYRELASGGTTLLAQTRAQQSLYSDPRRHLQRRHRDEERKPIELRDWWLPQFYQQRPLELQLLKPEGGIKQHAPTSRFLSESVPAEPPYGFSGRARELLQIERWLLRGKVVVISGFGGIGKTALAREAGDWLARTKLYDGICFVSFEHGGDSTLLLSSLGHSLNINDGHYHPDDPVATLAILGRVLSEKRILVIADNVESILPGGEASLNLEARTQLWDVLLDLVNLNAGVIVTSRATDFADRRLAFGNQVAHLVLGGLHPDDAYELASNLLNQLGIDRASVPHKELRDLLAQLDHHPLAIQLVLPMLRDLPSTMIRGDLATHLQKFTIDGEVERNRSLLASLNYSLHRLKEEHQILLPRLALFEGGANEIDLLEITEIPARTWASLRQALEEAALLTAEYMHKAFFFPFLRFHPVLVPFLRSQFGASDATWRKRYADHYLRRAKSLLLEDSTNPLPIRMLIRRELPNLEHALDLLLEFGELEGASMMAGIVSGFLEMFGFMRESEELHLRVDEAMITAGFLISEKPTWLELLREQRLGKDELERGNVQAAYDRFAAFLARIEAQPKDTEFGYGSYEHCLVLDLLVQCLRKLGQLSAARDRLQEAQAVMDVLIKQQPDNEIYTLQGGQLLTELGNILRDQGLYQQAQEVYEERLRAVTHQGNLRSQAAVLGQLGTLALEQEQYAEAHSHYTAALDLFQTLGEPEQEARIWYQLGRVAEELREWTEAERCYRESLAIREQMGDTADIASTCTQLAIVTEALARPNEAEGWWKRALDLDEQVHPGSRFHASDSFRLARLLLDEIRADSSPMERLGEAQRYAELALAIDETLKDPAEIYRDLGILADIADLAGKGESARAYRHREHENFAAVAGNRSLIDEVHRQLIVAIAAATRGDVKARAEVEKALPDLESMGWHITKATRRIWQGERNWHLLTEDLDNVNALLVLRVLELLSQSIDTQPIGSEQAIASLPIAVRQAWESGGNAAFRKELKALPPEGLLKVREALPFLEARRAVQKFEPLLQAIVAIETENAVQREEMEATLKELEAQGWRLREVVTRMWAGEYDADSLTEGLGVQDTALVHRLLQIIEARTHFAAAEPGNEGTDASQMLTWTEYLHEANMGEDELEKGDLHTAYVRFAALLKYIEVLPEGTRLGYASYEHCRVLACLAKSLSRNGQATLAETHLRKALTFIDKLLRKQPGNQNVIQLRCLLLIDLGGVLCDQGQYSQAQVTYVQGLEVTNQQADLQLRARVLTELGKLALEQRDYAEAQSRFTTTLEISRILGDLTGEAIVLHDLGVAAQMQKRWAEAERCYRDSLAISEQLGDEEGITAACNQLATVAMGTGQPGEAEAWLRRALETDETAHHEGTLPAGRLNNLAYLLLSEVQAGHAPKARLIEAQGYAERALSMLEKLETSSEVWAPLGILADIASLEGQTEVAQDYHLRACKAFAAFSGNRYRIDHQYGPFIAAIAATVRGDIQARTMVERALLEFGADARGQRIATAIRRVLAGEREWHLLIADLNPESALLLLRILETILQPNEDQEMISERGITSLPPAILEAIVRDDTTAYEQALQVRSLDEYQEASAEPNSLESLESLEDIERESVDVDTERLVQEFESDLQLFAMSTVGYVKYRGMTEALMNGIEKKGWHLKEAVHRIWEGERDAESLTAGMEEMDSALLHRLMEMITHEALDDDEEELDDEEDEEELDDPSPEDVNRKGFVQRFEHILHMIAMVIVRETKLQSKIEAILIDLESRGWYLLEAAHRIRAGERDAESLTAGMDIQDAVLVRRILEIIGQSPEEETLIPVPDYVIDTLPVKMNEQTMASLPAAIRDALMRDDMVGFSKALKSLPSKEEQAILDTLGGLWPPSIREIVEQGNGIGSPAFEQAVKNLSPLEQESIKIVITSMQAQLEKSAAESAQHYELLLQAIATVATSEGFIPYRSKIERILAVMEKSGWRLREVVQRIWDGERNTATLTAGLEEMNTALILRVLEIIAEKTSHKEPVLVRDSRRDFLISYVSTDHGWAEWIAWQLQEAGYSTIIEAWDVQPRSDLLKEMSKAAREAECTILVLSPDYLDNPSIEEGSAILLSRNPAGEEGSLLPILVRECKDRLTEILGSTAYVDLAYVDDVSVAREKLLSAIHLGGFNPKTSPEPSQGAHFLTDQPRYPGAFPSVWNVPFTRNQFFVGRTDVLRHLYSMLRVDGKVTLVQPQAFNVPGGIGKTQTATEYAYQHYSNYQEGILWANAASPKTLTSDFVSIAALLDLMEKDEQDQGKIVAAVRRWLQDHDSWLLILDNADNSEILLDFLPSASKGHILLTTRIQSRDLASCIEIAKMGTEEGALLLLRRSGIIAPDAPFENASEADRAVAREISQAVDHLPLVLELAGAYIKETRSDLSNYLGLYQTQRAALMGESNDPSNQSVAIALSLSLAKIRQTNPTVIDLLQGCMFLYPDAIPEEIIGEGIADRESILQAAAADPIELKTALDEALKFSLVHYNPGKKMLILHRLVQAMFVNEMEESEQRQWVERTVRAINHAFPTPPFTDWQTCQRYFLQAQVGASLVEQWNIESSEAAQLLNKVGTYLEERLQYTQAELFHQRTLAILEKIQGRAHPDTAACLAKLGELYYKQGKYTQAEPFVIEALAIREKVLRPEHRDIAQILSNLATLYYAQGRYDEAEPLFARALTIWEKVPGAVSPDMAASLHNLAALYNAQCKYDQAEPLLLRALEIWEQTLGPEHQSVGNCLNSLAMIYYAQGNYIQAEPLFQRSIAIFERSLGRDHYIVARGLNRLAMTYHSQENYHKAEPLYLRALPIFERILGPDHPDMSAILANLAELYHAQDKLTQAEPLYLQVLENKEKALGSEHPEVAALLSRLAKLYSSRGEHTRAESLFRRALAIREKTLGQEHSDVATSLNDLASLYYMQGKYTRAEPLSRRALAIDEEAKGAEHPDVVVSLNILARLYLAKRKYARAEPLYERILMIDEKDLGSDHPQVIQDLKNLAEVYQVQGKYVQAETLYEKIVASLVHTLGDEHPEVAQSLHSLAMFYEEQGKLAQAEPIYRSSLGIQYKTLGHKHPDTIKSLKNLAKLYLVQNNYAQAEQLYRLLLRTQLEVLGAEHPEVAVSLNLLARLYKIQGRYAQAEPLYQRALKIQEKLGVERPNMVAMLNSLAELYRDQGKYAQAEPLYLRALEIQEKLGAELPNMASLLANLAGLYQDQGKFAQAEALYLRSLSIGEQALGPDDPEVAQCLHNLAGLYHDQGKYVQVKPLLLRALKIQENALGSEHPNVAQSFQNLATLYLMQNEYAQAESICLRALAIREKILGSVHPDTAQSLQTLASIYEGQSKYIEAEALFQKALTIQEETLGPGHPDVAQSLHNLAGLYYALDKHDQAEPLLQRTLTILEQNFGQEHPLIATTLRSYAALLRKTNREKEAVNLETRAHMIMASQQE